MCLKKEQPQRFEVFTYGYFSTESKSNPSHLGLNSPTWHASKWRMPFHLDPRTSVRHASMAHQHTEHCHLAVHNLNIFQKTRHKWWNEIEDIDNLVYVHSSGSDDTVDWPWTGYRTVMTCHHQSLCVFLAVMCVITVWTQSQTQFFFSPSLFPPDIWSYATL